MKYSLRLLSLLCLPCLAFAAPTPFPTISRTATAAVSLTPSPSPTAACCKRRGNPDVDPYQKATNGSCGGSTTVDAAKCEESCCKTTISGKVAKMSKGKCEDQGNSSAAMSECDDALEVVCCQTHTGACTFPEKRQECKLPLTDGWGGFEVTGPCDLPSGQICCIRDQGNGSKVLESAIGCCVAGGVVGSPTACASPTPTQQPVK